MRSPYWPDMWSLDYLRDRRRQAPVAFSFQYQNQVVQTSELSLSPDLIIKGTIDMQFETLGVGVDLSAGVRERNDYTVFVMGGRVGGKIHIIDCKRLRIMGNLEKLEALMEMMEEWGVISKDNDQYFQPAAGSKSGQKPWLTRHLWKLTSSESVLENMDFITCTGIRLKVLEEIKLLDSGHHGHVRAKENSI